jgi:two-component system OmpR family sensor kinase
LLVPALALLIAWIVRRTLRPIDALARDIARRPADSLEPLPVAALPAEVRPLVEEINVLLGRLGTVLERERAFTADAAHELRSPLTALRLQLDRLGAAIEDGDGAERRLAHAQLHDGVARATRLVEQLLAMARLEVGGRHERRTVALDQLAREVVEAALPLADQRGIDLGLERAEPLAIDVEPEGLRALLGNLVDNALRHAPRSGHVDVSVRRAAPEVGAAECAMLEVVDDGPGIPAAERERVFDRFYRVPGGEASGSGIGLAIVRAVAERHGGRVELADGPDGRGLAARVWLPLRVASADGAPARH